MGERSAELRHEVEAARAALARDIDRLTTKASPHRIAGRGIGRTRSRLRQLTDRVRSGRRLVPNPFRRR
jgi:hypothetical protein